MKFLDLSIQYKTIKKEIDDKIKKVLDNGVFIGGEEVEEFEKEIANFCGSQYGISVNSGTDALLLALKALEVGPGDEAIVPSFTFIASAEIIANLGARPVFVDIEPQTFNINSQRIEEKINKKTKAIIVVHLFGQMAEMDEIMRIAEKYKLAVIEDAAQAIGAEYENKRAGSLGDCGCFSFFPAKNLGGFGDGGMVVTSNKNLADKIRLLKNHGSSPKEKYLNLILGTNSRLDSIQAGILRIKLKYLNQWNQKRVENACYYNKFLKGVGDIIIPVIQPDRCHIFHQYTIRTKERDSLREYLKENNIPTMIYYSLPLHLQPAFKYLDYELPRSEERGIPFGASSCGGSHPRPKRAGRACRHNKKGDLAESEKAAQEVLSLPIYPELSIEEQNLIIQKIKDFYA